ncbi:MAG TPA: universal stress protein [Microvirga sp.]|nr:universal stress protein [Microvirga sp.]
MKTVLVPVEERPYTQFVLEAALMLAQSFESYLEGLALGPDIPNVYALDVPVVVTEILDEPSRREIARRSRARFETAMQAHGIPERFGEPTGLSFGWYGDDVLGDSFLGDYGRVFDVIVVGRPSTDEAGPRMATLEEALFASGRPVLVAPPQAFPTAMGRSVVIAWNGSTETARAVSLGMPLLRRAKQVVVLTVEGGTVPGPTGEQLARTLRINGVPAQAHHTPESGSVGETILATAREVGADLLVKGAYTQSRLRQMIFGGATRHLLDHAPIPMLMAH